MKKHKTKSKKRTSPKIAKTAKSVKPSKFLHAGRDIVSLISAEHIPLKKMIKVLRDPKSSIDHCEKVFEKFAGYLITHIKCEEESLYSFMKDEEKFRLAAYKGDVEHSIADQMIEEARVTEDLDLWYARIQVLADIVGRHLEAEEAVLLPEIKKYCQLEDRISLGEEYLALKAEHSSSGVTDTTRIDEEDEEEEEELEIRHKDKDKDKEHPEPGYMMLEK